MSLGVIGRKRGMTQIFSLEGEVVPVTIVEIPPGKVIQKKSEDKDGYQALQVGFFRKKVVSKPLEGHFRKAGTEPFSQLAEFRVENTKDWEVGQEIGVDIFEPGELVSVTGFSKGRGFAGGVKRWGFRGGPASHGSMFHRAPGSIGSSAFPSRVFKGKRLPGHYGNSRVTIKKVKIMDIRRDKNLILLRGPLPGRGGGIVTVKKR